MSNLLPISEKACLDRDSALVETLA